jgi:phage gpG-like protein
VNGIEGLQNIEAFRARLLRWSQIAPKEVETVLKQGAELVRREAQEKHLSGPKMPRGVGDEENATLAVQTGTLRRSISLRVHVAEGKIQAEVGTKVGYGRKHELGLEGMPERPFLAPSLKRKATEIFNMIRAAFFKSYGK